MLVFHVEFQSEGYLIPSGRKIYPSRRQKMLDDNKRYGADRLL